MGRRTVLKALDSATYYAYDAVGRMEHADGTPMGAGMAYCGFERESPYAGESPYGILLIESEHGDMALTLFGSCFAPETKTDSWLYRIHCPELYDLVMKAAQVGDG